MKDLEIFGYRRKDGSFGIRNNILVIPTVNCGFRVTEMIKEKARFVTNINNQAGCTQIGANKELTFQVLANISKHPNVYGVIIIGIGCEGISKVAAFNVQDAGGSIKAAEKGIKIANQFKDEIKNLKKDYGKLSELTIGIKCGASNSLVAFGANPAIGKFVDDFIGIGGTVIMSETIELIRATRAVYTRIKDKKEKEKFKKIISDLKKNVIKECKEFYNIIPSMGNVKGGVSTVEEKSFSGLLKAGTSKIKEVVNFGTIPTKNGLIFMDTPLNDVLSLTGMGAGGCHLILFATGLGSPVGSPVSPVLKISSTTELFNKLNDNIDIDAGKILDNEVSTSKFSNKIYKYILKLIEGKKTKSEKLKHNEFGIPPIGCTY